MYPTPLDIVNALQDFEYLDVEFNKLFQDRDISTEAVVSVCCRTLQTILRDVDDESKIEIILQKMNMFKKLGD